MIFVSLGELLKETEHSFEEDGYEHPVALTLTYVCLFGGVVIGRLCDMLVHSLWPKGSGPHSHSDAEHSPVLPEVNEKERARMETQETHEVIVAAQTETGALEPELVNPNQQPDASRSQGQVEGVFGGSAEPEAPFDSPIPQAPRASAQEEQMMQRQTKEKRKSKETEEERDESDGCSTGIQVKSEKERTEMKRLSFVTFIALTLHNMPEGVAVFIAALFDTRLGIVMTVAIACHNIPEGIAVAIPYLAGTGNRWRAFGWAAASGLAELVGGCIGALIIYVTNRDLQLSNTGFGIAFGLTAGVMLFVAFAELAPAAYKYDHSRFWAHFAILVGFAIMALSEIILAVAEEGEGEHGHNHGCGEDHGHDHDHGHEHH